MIYNNKRHFFSIFTLKTCELILIVLLINLLFFPIKIAAELNEKGELVVETNISESGSVFNNFDIHGVYGVVYSPETNEVLFGKNEHEKAYPASITKILTSIILLEKTKEGELISISQFCINKPKSNSQIEFTDGEMISREEALKAIMILSANDVSCAVSEHISGDEKAFGELMTEKAKSLGAMNTQFTNAHGLFDSEHYTTAFDMALIAKEALKFPEILKVMRTKNDEIVTNRQTVSIYGKGRYYERENLIGGKTGFVNESGNTLVEIIEIDGVPIINVIMKSKRPEIDNDMDKIYDRLKEHYRQKNILSQNEIFEISFLNQKIDVYPNETYSILTENRKDSESKTQEKEHIYKVVFKPDIDVIRDKNEVKKNEKIGEFLIFKDNEIIKVIEAKSNNFFYKKETSKSINVAAVIIFAILISNFLYFVFSRRQRE